MAFSNSVLFSIRCFLHHNIMCRIINGTHYARMVTLRHAQLVVGISTGPFQHGYGVGEVSHRLFTVPSQKGP